jgi:hypothetical protein
MQLSRCLLAHHARTALGTATQCIVLPASRPPSSLWHRRLSSRATCRGESRTPARWPQHLRSRHRPARPFPSSIFLDKNRRDIGKCQSIWTDSKMETAGSRGCDRPAACATPHSCMCGGCTAAVSQPQSAAHACPSKADGREAGAARSYAEHWQRVSMVTSISNF